MYKDEFSFSRRSYIVKWRNGSLSLNSDEKTVHGKRVFCKGNWIISSDYKVFSEELGKYHESLVRNLCGYESGYANQENTEEEQFIGKAEFLVSEKDNVNSLIKKSLYVASVMKDTGITGEITIATFIDKRKIAHSLGEAEERKQYTTVIVEVHQQRGADLVKGSSQLVVLGDPGQLSEKNIEMMIEHAYRKAFWSSRALETSSNDRGRKTLVLTASISSVIVKEFVRRLLQRKISELGLGKQIVSSNLTIRDEPLSSTSPSIRAFDDECVKTRKKTLVENGVLVELLGTKFNAGTMSKPGNAYGLWEPPTPFYTNLHLSKGDWDEKEIIEETKEGFLIDGAASYMVRGDVLSIYPESAWRIRRGELVEPIIIKEIKLPITDTLSNIDALGKSHQRLCSWEKHWLVCEESLMLRTIGHVL